MILADTADQVIKVLGYLAVVFIPAVFGAILWFLKKLHNIHGDVKQDVAETQRVHERVNGGPDGLEARLTTAFQQANRAQEQRFFDHVAGKVAPLSAQIAALTESFYGADGIKQTVEKIQKTVNGLRCQNCGADVDLPDCPNCRRNQPEEQGE